MFSLRSWLSSREADGAIIRIRDRVSTEFEIAGVLAAADGRETVVFDDVQDSALPVVGNVTPNRVAIARACGADSDRELQRRIIDAIDHPLTPQSVASTPRAVTVEMPDVPAELPVPRFFEREPGRYITAGAIVAADETTGRANLSIARIMPLGGNRALVGIAPNHHLAVLLRAAHERGRSLEIAVTLGNHPIVMLAACLYLGLGEDELAVAGALHGTGIEVVTTANGLRVPAASEIVLEGTLDGAATAPEEQVSEFHGMYESYGPGAVVTFRRLTRRHDAMVQTILPGYHAEHGLLGGVAIAAGLMRAVRARVPALREVAVGMGGAGRLHAVAAVRSPQPSDVRDVIEALWSEVNLIKRVVVVDDDVDPWDPVAVEWALATRMRAERDIVVRPGMRTDRSEPLNAGGTVTKYGFDATRRAGDRTNWALARPPLAASERGRQLIEAARAFPVRVP